MYDFEHMEEKFSEFKQILRSSENNIIDYINQSSKTNSDELVNDLDLCLQDNRFTRTFSISLNDKIELVEQINYVDYNLLIKLLDKCHGEFLDMLNQHYKNIRYDTLKNSYHYHVIIFNDNLLIDEFDRQNFKSLGKIDEKNFDTLKPNEKYYGYLSNNLCAINKTQDRIISLILGVDSQLHVMDMKRGSKLDYKYDFANYKDAIKKFNMLIEESSPITSGSSDKIKLPLRKT